MRALPLKEGVVDFSKEKCSPERVFEKLIDGWDAWQFIFPAQSASASSSRCLGRLTGRPWPDSRAVKSCPGPCGPDQATSRAFRKAPEK
jgi:hypothetical protein